MHFGKPESKEYLEKCIQNFTQAKSLTTSQHAIESIQIQKSFYEKQLDLLILKNTLYDRSLERTQKDETMKTKLNEHIEDVSNLQKDLLNTVSLMEKEIEELIKNNTNLTEIQQLNTQFSVLLCKLFNCVDETLRENVALKDRRQAEIKLSPCDVDNQATKINEIINTQELSDESSEEEIGELPPLECPDFDLDK